MLMAPFSLCLRDSLELPRDDIEDQSEVLFDEINNLDLDFRWNQEVDYDEDSLGGFPKNRGHGGMMPSRDSHCLINLQNYRPDLYEWVLALFLPAEDLKNGDLRTNMECISYIY